MAEAIRGVRALQRELGALPWVTDLFVGGSAASGDYVPGVSDLDLDLDLVAIVDGRIDAARRRTSARLHIRLDQVDAAGANLGCAYVAESVLHDSDLAHPTWTHGRMVRRPLSGVARAIEAADAPPWLRADLRARRRGEQVGLARWRTAGIAWRDARRTTRSAARYGRTR